MPDRENLPSKPLAGDVAVLAEQRNSLVTRGLVAVQNRMNLALTKNNDALYRQARTVYNLITHDGGTTWVGERLGRGWLPSSTLADAFEVFRQLASEGYGKAYYPLSTLYGGEQSIVGDKNLSQHFAKLAFEWCFASRLLNDPEIWNDLGNIYLHQDNEQALHWFRKAAAHNHAWGLFNLSGMYECGCGVEQNYGEALRWQIRAAEQGNLAAIFGLIHQCEFHGPDHEPDDEQALHWYRKAAEQGYPWTEADFGADRFFELGKRYWGDRRQEVDEDKAREYFLAASNLEHAEAQYELSNLLGENGEDTESEHWLKSSSDLGFGPAQRCYAAYPFVPEDEAHELNISALVWYEAQAEDGNRIWQYEYADFLSSLGDSKEGLRWLKASAEQDYRPACARLGREYLRAGVSEHTTRQGIYWLSHAADLGDTSGCQSLGDLYLLGHDGGTPVTKGRLPPRRIQPDKKSAITWYECGIDLGNRWMAYSLGVHYLTGEYLDQDLQLAEKWLLHSAMEGCVSAQVELGSEYASGARLRLDVHAAIHWLELAVESHVSAALKLADIYLEGKVGPKNFAQAIEWLTRAADSGTFRNSAMKIVTKKCFDGRFCAAEEAVAQTWLVQMAAIALESVDDADDHNAAGSASELAELYELGLGVAQDMGQAIHWYKQAAEQGSSPAKTRLRELGVDWKSA